MLDEFFVDPFPPIDIYETKAEIILEIEIPGVNAEDISITLKGDIIEIEGVKREKLNVESVKFIRMERHSGHFKRSVRLPFIVGDKNIKAKLKNGVLKVIITKPKSEVEVERL